MNVKFYQNTIALLSGILFAIGLGISGMALPEKVIGFLDVFGSWDPSLAFVMVGAILTYALLYQVAQRRREVTFVGTKMQIPTNRRITAPLVIGASLFGAGWGLSGLCPGPALISSVTGNVTILMFMVAVVGGMQLFTVYDRVMASRRAAREATTKEQPQRVKSAKSARVVSELPIIAAQ
jgi:uncharacterized membrane protein YedE/YeeE